MALSAQTRMNHQLFADRRPSLMDRVKSVGNFLKSDTVKTIAFVGSSAIVGAAAKFGSVALLSAFGATAAAGVGTALGIAMAGGAVVGVTKTGLSALFNKKAADKPTAGTLVKNVLLGSAISGATFGILSGADAILNNTDVGRQLIEKTASLYNDYSPKMGSVLSSVRSFLGPDPLTARQTPILPITVEVEDSLAPNEAAVPASAPAAPTAAPAPALLDERPTVATDATPKAAPRVHSTYESAAQRPEVATPAAADVVPVVDAAAEELAKVQAALDEDYVAERLRSFILETTGVEPAADATLLDMAKAMSEKNPEAVLKSLAQQAPKLDREHMAAFCTTEIPTSFGAENTIPTHCTEIKPNMADNDFATLRDVNQPDPKKGLRALFAKGVAGTRDFIDKAVIRGAVAEMTEDAHRGFFQSAAGAAPANQ